VYDKKRKLAITQVCQAGRQHMTQMDHDAPLTIENEVEYSDTQSEIDQVQQHQEIRSSYMFDIGYG
jgi:hypothetical protein